MPHTPEHKKKRKTVLPPPGSTERKELDKAAETPIIKSVSVQEAGGERTIFGKRAEELASQKGFQKLVGQGDASIQTEQEFQRQQLLTPQERLAEVGLPDQRTATELSGAPQGQELLPDVTAPSGFLGLGEESASAQAVRTQSLIELVDP